MIPFLVKYLVRMSLKFTFISLFSSLTQFYIIAIFTLSFTYFLSDKYNENHKNTSTPVQTHGPVKLLISPLICANKSSFLQFRRSSAHYSTILHICESSIFIFLPRTSELLLHISMDDIFMKFYFIKLYRIYKKFYILTKKFLIISSTMLILFLLFLLLFNWNNEYLDELYLENIVKF